ncbi:MAG: LysR family transcriptional regulator [Candidatus Competibacteraceae bacterium]|nr:LysR family transcriptional regulator [Candidatus Competibacteraceae bacterium]
MDIDNLQAFVAVAEQGSFSQAAQGLHLTQPAVSKRISTLESVLEVRLFDRIGRKVLLTEAGRTLLPRARRILGELADGRRALANLSGRIAGPLVLATSHHIGLHRLPPVLRAFVSRFPQVQLDMRFMDSEQACDAIGHGEMELGVVTLPSRPPATLLARHLWHDPLLVVVNPHHPLAKQRLVSPFLLATYPAILPGAGTFTRGVIQGAFEPLGIELIVAFSTNYLETIKMMVSVGLGWSMLPRTMLDGGLAVLELEGLEISRTLGTVHHKGRTLSNAAQAMLDTLQGQGRPSGGGSAPWRGY